MNALFSIPRPLTKSKSKDQSLGRAYDLQSIFNRLNRIYFDSSLELTIKWSARLPRKAKTSIELGSYHHESKTITISKRLDRPEVPLYFLEYVVFHEMLHHVFPREKHRMHTEKFKRYERMYPDYERAVEWEKKSLRILFDGAQKNLWS